MPKKKGLVKSLSEFKEKRPKKGHRQLCSSDKMLLSNVMFVLQ